MPLAEDKDVIQTVAPTRSKKVFSVWICHGDLGSECQGKRSDQTLEHHFGGSECRPSAVLRICFQPVQNRTTIHVSSWFFRGTPVK
jgi:hypothetical protein